MGAAIFVWKIPFILPFIIVWEVEGLRTEPQIWIHNILHTHSQSGCCYCRNNGMAWNSIEITQLLCINQCAHICMHKYMYSYTELLKRDPLLLFTKRDCRLGQPSMQSDDPNCLISRTSFKDHSCKKWLKSESIKTSNNNIADGRTQCFH